MKVIAELFAVIVPIVIAISAGTNYAMQQMPEIVPFISVLRDGGLVACLVLFIWGLHTGKIYLASEYKRVAKYEQVAWDLAISQKKLGEVVSASLGVPEK
jgi:hypothetical protein